MVSITEKGKNQLEKLFKGKGNPTLRIYMTFG